MQRALRLRQAGQPKPKPIHYDLCDAILFFTEVPGTAAESGNRPADYRNDHDLNLWKGKRSTGLQRAVSEVVAQRLATAVLGVEGAPITVLASQGTIFSRKPLGPSENLQDFVDNPDNFGALSEERKTSIKNTFLNSLIFKVIVGDVDISPENFVIDKDNNVVIPIDGELYFPGTTFMEGEVDNEVYDFESHNEIFSDAKLSRLLSDPGEYINRMFKGKPGFLSEGVHELRPARKLADQLNLIWNGGDYWPLNEALNDTAFDLKQIGLNKSSDNVHKSDAVSESVKRLDNIKTMVEGNVIRLWNFVL